MTKEELREFIANLGTTLGAKIAEVAELQKRNEEEQRKTDRQLQETDRQMQETDRRLKELGDKFGSFTEGMALPSMTRILQDRFQMDIVSSQLRARHNGHSMELDVLAISRKPEVNAAYVVEVRSHLREDGLRRMKQILRDVRHFFPYLADKQVYGILAVVDTPPGIRQKVLREGIYLARIHDEEFDLEVPADFRPRAF